MTVMGDALMDGLSDAGSIPARSIKNREFYALCFIMCRSEQHSKQ